MPHTPPSEHLHPNTAEKKYDARIHLPQEFDLNNDTVIIPFLWSLIPNLPGKRKQEPLTGFVTLEDGQNERFFKWQPVQTSENVADRFIEEISRQVFLNDLLQNPHNQISHVSSPELLSLTSRLQAYSQEKIELNSLPVRAAKFLHFWNEKIQTQEVLLIELDNHPPMEITEKQLPALLSGLEFLSQISPSKEDLVRCREKNPRNPHWGPFPIRDEEYYKNTALQWIKNLQPLTLEPSSPVHLTALETFITQFSFNFMPRITHTDPAPHNITFTPQGDDWQLILYDLEDVALASPLEDVARLMNTFSTKNPEFFESFVSQLKQKTEYLKPEDYPLLRFFRIYKELLLANFFLKKDPQKSQKKLLFAQQLLDSEDPFMKLSE